MTDPPRNAPPLDVLHALGLRPPDGVEVHEIDTVHGREEWLALRRWDMTASSVACLFKPTDGPVVTHHPWTTPEQLLEEKLRPTPDRPSPVMLAGRYYEHATAARLVDELPGCRVHDVHVYVRSPRWRLGVTVDRVLTFAGSDGTSIAEIKTVIFNRWDARGWAAAAPLYAQLQAATGALLLGAAHSHVVAEQRSGFGLGNFAIHKVERDPRIEREIMKRSLAFCRGLDARRS